MKNQVKKYTERLVLVLLSLVTTVGVYAQDGGLEIDVNIGEKEWYQQPWAWVVGGALFVLILVALLRKRK
ncbi:hypothetical protein [Algoriphagus sp. NG3]|uniref:hypothetical protein n=1 Tax=Algoriphagus sp. NG3 TaxID=3097546 RepID=UPI002A807A30|nr:hypothetical protein [Algoriphagus sp. NG3]WPR74561.1 hypothetical protein SLW71_18015 [Algoriphagus sp. NG3]